MAYTGDSNAPLRDVKRVQFGILGPDEVVRFVFIMLFSYSNSINLLFVLCVSVLFNGLANVIEFYTQLIKNTLLNVNWCVSKILRKRGDVLLQINDVGYTITPFCGVDLLPFLSKIYCGYNYTLTRSIFFKISRPTSTYFLYVCSLPFSIENQTFH